MKATLQYGDLLQTADMLCSISFDRDDEFFATAGVLRRIKVCIFLINQPGCQSLCNIFAQQALPDLRISIVISLCKFVGEWYASGVGPLVVIVAGSALIRIG